MSTRCPKIPLDAATSLHCFHCVGETKASTVGHGPHAPAAVRGHAYRCCFCARVESLGGQELRADTIDYFKGAEPKEGA